MCEVDVGQVFQDVSVIHGGMAIGDLDMAPAFERSKHHEEISGAVPLVLVVKTRRASRLLENKVVELGIVDRASDSTIGRALKKTLFSPIAASTGSSRRRPTARL